MSKALLYRFPQRLHCPSQNLATYVSSYYKISRRCVVVVPLGADEKRFSPPTPDERTHYRERLGLAPTQFVLVFAGRLNPEKNLELLLSSLARDEGLFRKVHLLVAGNGPLEAQLRARTIDLGLTGGVTFLGYVKELRPVYGASDVLVLPSRNVGEFFPLVVIEAALCALPCLRSNTFAACDQIEDGVNGELFREGDEDDLYCHLLGLVADPERVRRMGLAAHKRAAAQFTLSAVGKQFQELIKDLISGRKFSA
jgi:glycosyltransferase involved in cell wall biosynthesis